MSTFNRGVEDKESMRGRHGFGGESWVKPKNNLMSKRVADQLVEMMVQAGIKRIYGITGDSLNALNDAVRRGAIF